MTIEQIIEMAIDASCQKLDLATDETEKKVLQAKYVNLKYLLQKLQADEEFVVTEHKTGVDITAKTMRQAVATSDLTLEQIKKALR
jgi:hypothetical protein